MQSSVINKIKEIEHELKVNRCIDPRRKRYLVARLLQLQNEATNALGFTSEEMKTGEVAGPDNIKNVDSRTYYVPPPGWVK
jgi:hypothetical protein